ncbi:MAG TPA: hypothetical protein VE642_05470 [Pyrinomonadaceae bacterium]|jgi:hypothetical protein|nr:hypothetical protein [Pyrinomonadaceae bacterium]
MNLKPTSLAAIAAALLLLTPARQAYARPAQSPFGFRQGQSVYIVAFTRSLINVGADAEGNGGTYRDYFDYQLDAEKKVREKLEDWKFFRVAEKPSEADFVFLVNWDGSAMEGLAIPLEAYNLHFKDKFDLDALRDAAYGRYIAGPLKLPTLSRLSDRLVKQFRERLARPAPKGR